MKTKFFALLSAVALVIPFIKPCSSEALNFTLKDSIRSESAILINLDSDTIIHEKNADTKQMPGPLVNIMTAVVCIEECPDLNAEITVDEEVYSSLYDTEYYDDLRFANILDGDVLTYMDLLYAMMLTSSVEASQTIAYNIGGESVTAFVEKMNAKADEIGLTSTNFTNPTGMYDTNQYTTARDMAVLTEYALTVPHFDKICSTYSYNPSVPNLDRHEDHSEWVWYHSNTMMDSESDDYYYPGARGVKTGNLEKGGRNIVSLASKDGHNYLVVAMKSQLSDEDGNVTFYHLEDAMSLFDWAFNHFSYQVILAETTEIRELPVSLADGNGYVLAKPKEEVTLLWYDDIDISLISRDNITWYKTDLQAPVKKGELLGEVTLEYSGEPLATVELVAVSDVERSWSKYNLYAAKMFPKSDWFRKALIISSVLCVIYILICVYSFMIFKNNSKPVKPKYAVPKVENRKKKK
ncbi:MAG: D-alanyl-D-alanine carboxypeptidase [Ruminococcus flavefaciens]|nr:D-alanyl-D-alanine carboxypeptidase [Ruminococcus flavefaciens]MCM1229667.1 D-alanyl-D-alanine carboxypeptidase [Ruminococcus flavefaciens]